MARLTREVIYKNIRFEEAELTEEQLAKWKTGDKNLQQEVLNEIEWDLVGDKTRDEEGEPELEE